MTLFAGSALVALGLFLAFLSMTAGGGRSTGVARSLELIEQVSTTSAVKVELSARARLLDPLLNGTRGIAERLSPGGSTARLSRMIERAGNPPGWTVERTLGFKGVALFFGIFFALFVGKFSITSLLVYAPAAGALLFMLPDLLLYNKAVKRRDELGRGLADALDMLSVCVEAGQGFDAAMLQVARNVEGPISAEFARVLSEIQIGRSRAQAFTGLGQRVELPEVRNFVSAVVQADAMGLPLAGVLKEQTTAMRTRRRQRAEEKAQQIALKILFPLMFFIFPVLLMIVMGPGVINGLEALKES